MPGQSGTASDCANATETPDRGERGRQAERCDDQQRDARRPPLGERRERARGARAEPRAAAPTTSAPSGSSTDPADEVGRGDAGRQERAPGGIGVRPAGRPTCTPGSASSPQAFAGAQLVPDQRRGQQRRRARRSRSAGRRRGPRAGRPRARSRPTHSTTSAGASEGAHAIDGGEEEGCRTRGRPTIDARPTRRRTATAAAGARARHVGRPCVRAARSVGRQRPHRAAREAQAATAR